MGGRKEQAQAGRGNGPAASGECWWGNKTCKSHREKVSSGWHVEFESGGEGAENLLGNEFWNNEVV